MDARTLKALEFSKVLDHLADFCLSEAGADACRRLLPENALPAVHAARQTLDDYHTWSRASSYSPAPFPDIRPLFGFLRCAGAAPEHGELDVDALWTLKTCLIPAATLVPTLREHGPAGACYPRLAQLAAAPLPEMSIAALARCISDDALLRDESSPGLMLARTELRQLHQRCLRQVRDFSARYNIAHYLQEEWMTLASDRYVLPLKANFKGRLQGVVHGYSQTGETCYFEPMFLVEHNNRLQELKRREREEERKVLICLTDIVRREEEDIRALWDLLVGLDVLRAKQLLGEQYAGVCVPVDETACVNLLRARHPLLALELKDGAQPVDVSLRPGDLALIISGGNAGGKTVCLKTLGLINAMTLAGIPVPADRASILPWWPQTYAFIGDEQSLDAHLSTFTAQIRHLEPIWSVTQAGGQILVLLDEFGAGTDPAQGAALARAVIDALLERRICVIAATHFPALKIYALTREEARAASVLFDPQTGRPLYCLAYDQVGASRALDVAREHGLPESVLRRAEHYLLPEGRDAGALLERLNALTAQREREIEQMRQEQTRLREKQERMRERFEQERRRLETELGDTARTIMREWRAGRMAHKQALKELAKTRAMLAPAEERQAPPPPVLAPGAGQAVLYRPWNKKALVSETDLRQDRVKLDINGVAMWVRPDQVVALPFAQAEPPSATSFFSVSRPSGGAQASHRRRPGRIRPGTGRECHG